MINDQIHNIIPENFAFINTTVEKIGSNYKMELKCTLKI